MKSILKIHILLISLLLFSCNRIGMFSVEEFEIINNFKFSNNTHEIEADLSNAVSQGIVIPTKKQTANGYFNLSFVLNNPKYSKYYYKIYYQNSDYKYAETDMEGNYNPLSNENFYGSWEDNDVGFKEIQINSANDFTVKDSFRIVGNPRNEMKYYGKNFADQKLSVEAINAEIKKIMNVPEWYSSIVEKAKKLNIDINDQLILDAKWMLASQRNIGKSNNRWKRNPRMGNYEAVLVVTNPAMINRIPHFIRNISLSTDDGNFLNPFYYFLYGDGKKLNDTYVIHIKNFIKLRAVLNPEKGVYVNTDEYGAHFNKTFLCETCNDSNLYFSALFEENAHHTVKEHRIPTIPLIADVNQNEYSLSDYINSEKKYDSLSFINQEIHYGNSPCENIKTKKGYIELINKGSKNLSSAEKRNIGVKTRIGFTYGKITAKIKFPSLLNSTNVWNGLTNAVWLLYQDKDVWNNRRVSKSGYTEKGAFSTNAPRLPATSYSEIDFEIVKTSKFWPKEYYKREKPPVEDGKTNKNVIVALTNWDLCNKDPKNYFYGIDTIKHNTNEYEALRWTDYYQALTIRTSAANDELFNREYYYFQVEWLPGEIIWRIGPSKNKLKEIGYMNDDVTSVPNNQMIMIMTQEYHMSNWWPPIPFKQEYIPFPKNDIVGKLYSVEVE